MLPEYSAIQSALFFGLTLFFLAGVIGDFRNASFFRAIGKMPDTSSHVDKATKSFFLFLLVFFAVAQDKSNLLYSGSEEIAAITPKSVKSNPSSMAEVYELPLESTSSMSQSLLSGDPLFPSNSSLTVSQFAAGVACVSVTNSGSEWASAATGSPALTNFAFGFSELGAWLTCTGALSRIPFTFAFGTNEVKEVYASSSGTLSFNSRKSSPFPQTNGIPDGTAVNYLAPFQTVIGLAPTNGAFLLDADEVSARFTWKDVFLGRDTNCPATVQAELYANGDFIYRYHFPAATNYYAQLTNLFLIGAQNNLEGETLIHTNNILAIKASLLPAFELRWKSLVGLSLDDPDPDGDGLTTSDELFIHRTNPRRADTDGDDISDSVEIANGTDSRNPDENDDGIPDGYTPEEWYANSLWAGEGKPANIRIELLDPIPTDSFAVLRIGDLNIPLVHTNQWELSLPSGDRVDFELIASSRSGYGTPNVRLSLSNPADEVSTEGFFISDSSGVFGGTGVISGTGWMAFPSIEFPYYSSCIHWGENVRFPITLRPAALNVWKNHAVIQMDGGAVTIGDDNTATLTLGQNSDSASFSIAFAPPFLRWGEVSVTACAHRCASIPGPFCSACGLWHHGECESPPLFVRTNTDDDNLDNVMDRDQESLSIDEDDAQSFNAFVRGPQLCCCNVETNAHIKILSIASGLRLWDGDTPLQSGDEPAFGFMIEALQPSQTLEGHPVTYEIHDSTNGIANTVTVRFQSANVLLEPDYNGDETITADDGAIDRWLASQAEDRWVVARRAEPYCLRIRNDCPSDTILSFAMIGETNRPSIKTTADGPIVITPLSESVTAKPLAEKNTDKVIWLDGSETNSIALLSYRISTTNDFVLVAATQTVQIIDTRIPPRWLRFSTNETTRYDFSESTENIFWILYSLPNLDYVSEGYGGIFDTPSGLPLGDYLVCAYFADIMDDGAYSEGELHVIDTVIEYDTYALQCGSTNRTQVSLCLTNGTLPANWSIEPELANGARLYTSENGGTALIAVTNSSSLWISAGTIPTNYTLTAIHPEATNCWDKSTVNVIKVYFSDSSTYVWDDVEEDVEPQPVIAAYPEHADEYFFQTHATPHINGKAKLQYIRNGAQGTDISWNGNEPTIEFSNGELNYQIIVLEGAESTPLAEAEGSNIIKVRHMNDGDQLVVALESQPEVNGSVRVVKNFSWIDKQALGQSGIFFGSELANVPENVKNNFTSTIMFALSQSPNSDQSIARETVELQMASIYTNPPPLLAELDVPSTRGIGLFPSDLYHLHITYSNEIPVAVQQAVANFNQAVTDQRNTLNIDQETSYLTKADRDKFWQLYSSTSSDLVALLGTVTNGAAVFIYHSYEVVEKDYIDPEGQTWMRAGDPIRNLRNELSNNTPLLNYPGDPNNASAVYQYQNLIHTTQLSFLIQKNGNILLFKGDSEMTKALQLRQAFDE
jgi:hypothetical protein